jgi:hypothetical protein
MRTLVLGVALIAILAPAGTGAAQDFPSHPITIEKWWPMIRAAGIRAD